jgi:hypothetical protein
LASPRAVRIPRPRTNTPASLGTGPAKERPKTPSTPPSEVRPNVGGFQRAVRLTMVFVVALTLLYAGFVLYDRTVPGGTSSVTGNGILVFTGVFLLFAAGGTLYSLTPAPRSLEVYPDRVTVVGRWGRRRTLPPLEQLYVIVVRRYPAGLLSSNPVELVEVSGADTPRRSYLADASLFDGANPSLPRR